MGSSHLPPISVPADAGTLGYLAGLVDGEGNISIGVTTTAKGQVQPSYALRVSIHNTSFELMAWLVEVVGGSFRSHGQRKAGWKAGYTWTVHGENAERLLQGIEPYLRIKRNQCDVALRFRRLSGGTRPGSSALDPDVTTARAVLRDELLELNRRGARP